MYRVSRPHSVFGRFLKIGVSIGVAALLAACSSASERFGNADRNATDPGYRPNDAVHTGSLSPADQDFDRDVASQPLDDPTTPARYDASVPATNNSVIVRKGDTVYSISRRTGASVGDLIAINNLQPPYEIKTGQNIVLPASANRTHVAETPRPNISPAAEIVQTSVPGTHTVKPGQTLFSISRAYGYDTDTVAAHNRIRAPYTLKVGQNLHIPSRSQAQNAAYTPPAKRTSTPTDKPITPKYKLTPVTPKTPTPAVKTDREPAQNPAVPEMTSSKFRWPVKGRIISQYGSRPGGGRNDGINVAVPEGTSVKAAENGVVAYAGNELKGYGNLILIRHENNWVTAYAHNKQIFVRRGDTVKRGQIIAKAGKTGSVKSPQLHFEIRKGAQAVDPLKYLSPHAMAGN